MKFKKLVILSSKPFEKRYLDSFREISQILVHSAYPKSEREMLGLIKDADGLIVGYKKLDRKILEKCRNLKYIGIFASGYEHVDWRYAEKRNIVVTNTPHYATEAVAELIFGQLISFMRKTQELDKSMRQGRFEKYKFTGEELQGKTFGIIGLGRIGKRSAEVAKAFDMNVVYWDVERFPEYERRGVKFVSFSDLLKKSDIISLHAHLNERTRGLLGKKEFKKMKKSCILVNTARAAIVDKDALVNVLNSGRIAGAILEVFHEEPVPPNDPILKTKNTLLTPHMGWNTKEASERLAEISLENAKSYLSGKIINKVPELKKI
jgi:phosphoglycerate dehydrogenase-like enzyme